MRVHRLNEVIRDTQGVRIHSGVSFVTLRKEQKYEVKGVRADGWFDVVSVDGSWKLKFDLGNETERFKLVKPGLKKLKVSAVVNEPPWKEMARKRLRVMEATHGG